MIRIGILCPSEIAFRRFLPALSQAEDICRFSAIGIASPEEWFGNLSSVSNTEIEEQQSREYAKAAAMTKEFGGDIIIGYENLINSEKVDAVYIPLPPALHFKWAKKALEANKHTFVEKPSTTSLTDTDELIHLAKKHGLALHENYMFVFHNQLKALNDIISSGEIGNVRLFRINFGFPLRQPSDFRYNKALGGGALLDAGGYCLKYAAYLLGETAHIVTAQLNCIDGFEVEMYGSATMVNDTGETAQIAFGMDNDYRCEIDVWGSKGSIVSNRILTAPAGFVPSCTVRKNQMTEHRELPADDAFLKSIRKFYDCIISDNEREMNYRSIHHQELLLEQFKHYASAYGFSSPSGFA